ncbi:RNA polymerase sigma factor [Nocardia sp. alder85J]|uniref:RNA polymerase sigma factor n=1 Tax=Nocardia sp. alder85J TaxID=2862949 RepID=UPI001CD7CDA6|nr:sigma-70 family RNA polymerase sigma factor [Nocardia sp. alder85J]MCX4097956.1 sigma-70 family RNA polymerase sigma factor [Nocardia sp. alder85J]
MAGRPGPEHRAERPRARELRLVPADGYPDWESVYRDNVTWVYGLMFGKVGNRPDAEDLTAEVFTTALPPLRLTATAPEVRAYLRATARTVLAAHWQARLGREITTIDPEDIDSGALGSAPEPAAEPEPGGAAERRARAVLDRLPPRYRRILELRFLQGLSVRDAAAALEVTVANAKVLQHRALQMAARSDEEGAS